MPDTVLEPAPGETILDTLSQSSNPIQPTGDGTVILTPTAVAQEKARQEALIAQQPKRDPNASLWNKFNGNDIVKTPGDSTPPVEPEIVPRGTNEPPPVPQADQTALRNLRRDADERGRQIKDLQEKLSDYDTVKTQRDDAVKRLEELRKFSEGHEKIASVAALEQSDEYQEKFVKGEESLLEQIKQLSVENGIDENEVFKAVNNPNKVERAQQIASLYSGINEFNRDDFRQAVKNLDNLRVNRARALADAKTELQQSVAKRRQEENERNTAKLRESRDAWLSASLHAAELGVEDKTVREAEAFWNGARDRNKSALVVLKGFAYDKAQERIRELEGTLAQYQGAQPGLRTGTPVPVVNGSGEVTDLKSAMAKLRSGGYASTRL